MYEYIEVVVYVSAPLVVSNTDVVQCPLIRPSARMRGLPPPEARH